MRRLESHHLRGIEESLLGPESDLRLLLARLRQDHRRLGARLVPVPDRGIPGFGEPRLWVFALTTMTGVGAVHRLAMRLDDRIALVAGALSSDPDNAAASAAEIGIASDRSYAAYREMARAEAARADGGVVPGGRPRNAVIRHKTRG